MKTIELLTEQKGLFRRARWTIDIADITPEDAQALYTMLEVARGGKGDAELFFYMRGEAASESWSLPELWFSRDDWLHFLRGYYLAMQVLGVKLDSIFEKGPSSALKG